MIFGIDTQILIFAGIAPRKAASNRADITDLRARAKLLIYKAADREDTIILPTVAISELLVPVVPARRGALARELEKVFQCPPFDIPAATIAADLWAEFKKVRQAQDSTGQRNVLRADAMIVASARAANATHFYSHDTQCRTLAELAGMIALDLPVATELGDQYLLADILDGTLDGLPEGKSPQERAAKRSRKSKS